jgi:ATP-binding cassette subfamily C protein CydD
MQDSKKAARAWARQQTRAGRNAALPVVGFSLAGLFAAVFQCGCIAVLLGRVLGPSHVPAAPFLIGFAVLAVMRAGAQYLAERAAFTAGAVGRGRLRADAVGRLLAAGPALLRLRHSADLAAAAVDRIEALDGLFGRWVPAAIFAVAGPAIVLLAVATVDPWGGLYLAGFGLLVPVGQAVAGIGAATASRGQFLALTRLQARFLDRVRGIATIVLAGRAEDEALALAKNAAELRRRTMRVLGVAFLSSAAMDCAMAGAIITLALRYRRVLSLPAHSSPLTALFVLLLVPEFFAPLRAFAAAYQDRQHATGAAESLIDLPALPPPAPRPVREVEARGVAVAFENVTLSWDPARGPAIDRLSFFVAPGEMLVIAGPSGAGKSTIMELLLGFVHPDAGKILLNGYDMETITPQARAALTGWIGQKPMLFAGSIRDNIRFARPDATDAELDTAARNARVTDFADALPQGLDTPIGEGGYGISGGQAQRVAIARAFLKNAPLLLLDEPTAHLDPATEQEVLASLRRLAVGRTVVMASHSAAAHAFGGRRLDVRAGRAANAQDAA